jgi:photosystem II stability/assembly factor-like uncharacterized protein
MGGALAVAIDPADPDHLLLGTDSGLLATRNGGRDWDLLASDLLRGAVLTVAFNTGGRFVLAANTSTLAISEDAVHWQSRLMPVGASPPRALVRDTDPAAFYLLGWNVLFHTDDGGANWTPVSAALPSPVTSLIVAGGSVVAVASGEVWRTQDRGSSWQVMGTGLPRGQIEGLALKTATPVELWAAGASQLFRSVDGGQTWTSVGRALPEAGTHVRAIGLEADRILLSTDRGLYVSRDTGTTWELLTDNLPGHIEAGPLVSDSLQPGTVYVGFSVTPYPEIWQNAAAGTSALGRLSSGEWMGGAAFLALLGLCAAWSLRWLRGLTH